MDLSIEQNRFPGGENLTFLELQAPTPEFGRIGGDLETAGGFSERWRIDDEHFCGAEGAGFYVAESGQEGCEVVRFRREEKCRFGLVSARLEPDLHERARLLRERDEVIRNAGRGSVGR